MEWFSTDFGKNENGEIKRVARLSCPLSVETIKIIVFIH